MSEEERDLKAIETVAGRDPAYLTQEERNRAIEAMARVVLRLLSEDRK